MGPAFAIWGLWIAFALSWVAAGLWQTRIERRASLAEEWRYRATLVVGMVLFLIPAHGYRGAMRLWSPGLVGAWTVTLVMLAGFAFAWWARLELGGLWSSTVTRKQDHRVIETGPYRLVRHPIYTGILLALAATAFAKGTITGLVGATLLLLSFWLKARLEERFLSAELGEEAYAAYRRRVPMLIPITGP